MKFFPLTQPAADMLRVSAGDGSAACQDRPLLFRGLWTLDLPPHASDIAALIFLSFLQLLSVCLPFRPRVAAGVPVTGAKYSLKRVLPFVSAHPPSILKL